MSMNKAELYSLDEGKPAATASPFPSPLAEYRAAFTEPNLPFFNYHSFNNGQIEKRSLTRGDFWTLAISAAGHLTNLGIKKGDRVVHCFSHNVIYDLAFRLASVFIGCVPVTINWQADTNERIIYKAEITEAKLVIYNRDFSERLEEIKPSLKGIPSFDVEEIEKHKMNYEWTSWEPGWEDEKIIIFTSGTTGNPKGVSLSHRSYLGNRLAFEDWLEMTPDTKLDLLLVNPMHHANSTALTDWGLRRKNAIVNLVERYSTLYWKIIPEIAAKKRDIVFVSVVARHFDFLQTLISESRLPLAEAELKKAMGKVDINIGSAPVGPKTVKFVHDFIGYLPRVRYGSTETCLQVLGTPPYQKYNKLIKSFEAGWSHSYQGKQMPGFYIGRDHFPFTRTKVVRSVDPKSTEYMKTCEHGEPGYLLAQGPNVMTEYVGSPEATKAVLRDGWYTGLRDIVFTQKNPDDGKIDHYWMTRDSEMLIRGGANYAYDQVATELSKCLLADFKLDPEEFQLVVIGLRVDSEHDDSCCVTIELKQETGNIAEELQASFIERASKMVAKGYKPNYVRLAKIPRSFKGAIVYPQLRKEYLEFLGKT